MSHLTPKLVTGRCHLCYEPIDDHVLGGYQIVDGVTAERRVCPKSYGMRIMVNSWTRNAIVFGGLLLIGLLIGRIAASNAQYIIDFSNRLWR